jgi:hypothetical protein
MGASIVLGGANEAAGTMAQAFSGVTAEQIDAYKRSLSAPWNSRATILPINKWKDGVGKAINFSYFSPYDAVTQPFNAAIKTLEEGKMTGQKRKEILFQQLSPFGDGFIGKLISPFISEAIALERISDVLPAGFFVGGRGGETKTGSMIYSPTDELGTQMSKSFIHLLKGIEPGVVTTERKIREAITGDVSRGGVPRDLTDEALALFSGIRIINVDVPRTMQYKITEYNKNKRLVTATEKLFSLQDYKTRGPETLAREFRDIQEENLKVNKNFHNVIKDALEVGMPQKDLYRQLRKRGISKKNAFKLLRGQNIPYTGYKERMKKRVRDAQKIGQEQGEGNVNRDYFYPRGEFKNIEREYKFKSLNPKGPVDRSIIDRVIDYFSERLPVGEEGGGGGQQLSQRIQTPPLPPTNMPAQNLMAQSPQKINGLTRSEQALLSPEEKIIAART